MASPPHSPILHDRKAPQSTNALPPVECADAFVTTLCAASTKYVQYFSEVALTGGLRCSALRASQLCVRTKRSHKFS